MLTISPRLRQTLFERRFSGHRGRRRRRTASIQISALRNVCVGMGDEGARLSVEQRDAGAFRRRRVDLSPVDAPDRPTSPDPGCRQGLSCGVRRADHQRPRTGRTHRASRASRPMTLIYRSHREGWRAQLRAALAAISRFHQQERNAAA